MQLEFEQRQFLSRAITQARAHERKRFLAEAEKLRSEMQAERDRLLADVLGQCDELSRRLQATQAEFLRYRASIAKDKALIEEANRQRAIVAAWCAQRDENTLLN